MEWTATARAATGEIGAVLDAIDPASAMAMVHDIVAARRLALYGVGREGLMMKALAMRLYHLGLNAHVVGDMTTPPLGQGDLLIVSAGPGYFSTVAALIDVAASAGARTALFTAVADGAVAAKCDTVMVLPAQTMASDRGGATSVLPMGSLYEGVQYLTFELLVLMIRDKLDLSPEAMRANHTNLE